MIYTQNNLKGSDQKIVGVTDAGINRFIDRNRNILRMNDKELNLARTSDRIAHKTLVDLGIYPPNLSRDLHDPKMISSIQSLSQDVSKTMEKIIRPSTRGTVIKNGSILTADSEIARLEKKRELDLAKKAKPKQDKKAIAARKLTKATQKQMANMLDNFLANRKIKKSRKVDKTNPLLVEYLGGKEANLEQVIALYRDANIKPNNVPNINLVA